MPPVSFLLLANFDLRVVVFWRQMALESMIALANSLS